MLQARPGVRHTSDVDSLQNLRARQRAAGPDDQMTGFVFNGLLHHSTTLLGEEATARMRAEAQVPMRIVALFKYPVATFLAFTDLLAQRRVYAEQDFDFFLETIGDLGTRPFLESSAGQLMQMLNGGNVHRMMAYTPTAYDTVYTFGKRKAERTGERSGTMEYRGDLLGPAAQCGVLKVGLGLTCQAVISTALLQCDATGREFKIGVSW